MLTFGKRVVAFAFLLTFASFVVLAYDGTIASCEDMGNFSRSEFMNDIASDSFDEIIYDTMDEAVRGQGGRLERFFVINTDTMDDEDAQFLDDVETYLRDNYRIKNGSTYGMMVLRGSTDSGTDGWYVVSNFSNKDCIHIVYYYNMVF